jgi:HPt (histidine-containing phosphotransfer) domain-containing protein
LSKPIIKTSLTQILREWLPPNKLADTPLKVDESLISKNEGEQLFWAQINKIDGINVQTGLDIVSGQKNVYKDTLKLIIREIDKSEKNLTDFLAAGDMQNFRIEVHGVKGSLANIGALALSAQAYDLEKASGKLETHYCANHLPQLLSGLSAMGTALKKAFSLIKTSDEPLEIPPELPAIFSEMIAAFKEVDLETIDNAIENLNTLEMGATLHERIEQIKDAIITMDYDEAKDLMQLLLV